MTASSTDSTPLPQEAALYRHAPPTSPATDATPSQQHELPVASIAEEVVDPNVPSHVAADGLMPKAMTPIVDNAPDVLAPLPSQSPASIDVCICGQPSVFECSACGTRGYCSNRCQRKDWAKHKIACRAQSKRRSSSSDFTAANASAPDAESTTLAAVGLRGAPGGMRRYSANGAVLGATLPPIPKKLDGQESAAPMGAVLAVLPPVALSEHVLEAEVAPHNLNLVAESQAVPVQPDEPTMALPTMILPADSAEKQPDSQAIPEQSADSVAGAGQFDLQI